jgi:hypothetical protein
MLGRLVSLGLGPATAGMVRARRAERAARAAAGRAALGAIDGLLESEFADEVVNRVLASPATKRALGTAFSGPLVEAVARDVVEYAVLDRVLDQVLADETLERVVARLIDSRVLDEAVTRLLESEDLWVLVDEVAQSPAVTDAIGRQGVSFAGRVAGDVRQRSQRADVRLEVAARRLLRRGPPQA